jgi:hypothetical protein
MIIVGVCTTPGGGYVNLVSSLDEEPEVDEYYSCSDELALKAKQNLWHKIEPVISVGRMVSFIVVERTSDVPSTEVQEIEHDSGRAVT